MFPFIDLVRIIVLDQTAVNYIFRENHRTESENSSPNIYIQTLFKHLLDNNSINSMLVMRVFCNFFKSFNSINKNVLSFLLNERNFFFNNILKTSDTNNKALQITCATLVLNYTVLNPQLPNLDSKFTTSFCTDLIIEQIEFVNNDLLCTRLSKWDNEALFRMLVAFGNLMTNLSKDFDIDYIISVAKSLNNLVKLCQIINNSKTEPYTDKVSRCSKYLDNLFN